MIGIIIKIYMLLRLIHTARGWYLDRNSGYRLGDKGLLEILIFCWNPLTLRIWTKKEFDKYIKKRYVA